LARAVLVLVLVFLALAVLRALRVFLARWIEQGRAARRPPPTEGEMARDPVCGSWFDRRLGVPARLGERTVEVCSEDCRRRLEAG
jgi:hypothetical protein